MGALNFGRGAIKKCELIPAFRHGIGKNILCRLTVLSEAVLLDGKIFELKMREGVRRWSIQYTAPVRHPAMFSILSPWQPCIEIWWKKTRLFYFRGRFIPLMLKLTNIFYFCSFLLIQVKTLVLALRVTWTSWIDFKDQNDCRQIFGRLDSLPCPSQNMF